MIGWMTTIATAAAAPSETVVPFPQVDQAAASSSGIEIILIVFGAVLTIALFAFFVYVFTRRGE